MLSKITFVTSYSRKMRWAFYPTGCLAPPYPTLSHWGRVTHICVSKLTIIGSDNGLSPGRRQAIIWTNAGILSIRTLGTHFSEILSEIHAFSFKKMHLKMSSAKQRPLCLGLNVLSNCPHKDPQMRWMCICHNVMIMLNVWCSNNGSHKKTSKILTIFWISYVEAWTKWPTSYIDIFRCFLSKDTFCSLIQISLNIVFLGTQMTTSQHWIR